MALVTITSLLTGTNFSLPHPVNLLLSPGQEVTIDMTIEQLEASRALSDAKMAGYIDITTEPNSNVAPETEGATVSEMNVLFDMEGPTESVDGNLAAFDGTDGSLVKDSGVATDDVALLSGAEFTGDVMLTNAGSELADTLTLTDSNAVTVDWADGLNQTVDLEGSDNDVTVTFDNPLEGALYRLKVIQADDEQEIVWPVNVKWAGGTPPTLSTDEDAEDVFEFWYDGTSFYGRIFGQAFSVPA